jgi:hypothetical protein
MNWFLLAEIVSIIVALFLSFFIIVVLGVDRTPAWLLYTSMVVMALGGGAAIHLVLSKA